MHDQFLYAGKWWPLKPEVSISCGLHYKMLMSVPANTQYYLTLLVPNGFAYEKIPIIV